MTILHTIYLIAIAAEAASGALMGMRRRMDLFGICLIGTVTALGGGSVRDMLLGHYPLGWVAHPEYLLFTVGAAVAAAALARHIARLSRLRLVFLALDGLGLVAFSIIGCNVATESGASAPIAVLMGMVTGIFGGLIRDVLCNQVPLVLRRDLYASVSLLVGVSYMGMLHLKMPAELATLVALGGGFVLRMLAIRFDLGLPVFSSVPTPAPAEAGARRQD